VNKLSVLILKYERERKKETIEGGWVEAKAKK